MDTREPGSIVYSLDNVPLDLPIAGAGSRVVAGFIDYAIVFMLIMLWMMGAVFFGAAVAAASRGSTVGLIIFAAAVLGMFLIEYGYFAGFEIGTGGRTPGKMALGLHVVTRHGTQPTWGLLLVRNLVRTIDLLVGVPLMMFDPSARRLGDRLAGTLVVYQDPPALESQSPVGRIPSRWSAPEVALAESFLQRDVELDHDRATEIASLLLGAIQRDEPQLLEGLPPIGDPRIRLRRALAPRSA